MGVDGRQTLQIRGPDSMLTQMTESQFILESQNERITLIANRFFGSSRYTVKHRSEKYLVIEYEYRNLPIYEYLEELLRAYPSCWMKNEFSTDQGICGVWVARMAKGEVVAQEQAWTELCYEEILHGEDFSL
jgi:hypothetical protein